VSREITHLTVTAVKAIQREVLRAHGGSAGIREEALLESAIAAPQATMMGKPLISHPLEMAAAYLFYLCQNHPFVDGNKRTALASCLVFLETNGLVTNPKLPVNEWEKFVLDLASSKLDRAQTTARLRELLRELKAGGK
jgi:death-on-curing protein